MGQASKTKADTNINDRTLLTLCLSVQHVALAQSLLSENTVNKTFCIRHLPQGLFRIPVPLARTKDRDFILGVGALFRV